ncbi:MAG: enoyl-CoA hydratase/isomerase family protein, partial [Planctomycetota bacterium]
KRNALSVAMLEDLQRAFACADGVRAGVLLGSGSMFCAGFDLYEGKAQGSLEALRAQLRGLAGAIMAMRSSPFPIVVGVQGAALAGGCALLGGADIVLADQDARLGYPVVRLGISPAVTAPFLAARVGTGPARALLFDPALISGVRARELGLVDRLVDDPARVGEEARACAHNLASKPVDALGHTRSWVSEVAPTWNWQKALQVSLDALGDETLERMNREVWSR